MGHSTSGSAAPEVTPAGQQQPGAVRLADMLTLSCLISQTGQITVTFAGELDTASADQAYEYVRGAIDAHGGQVLLDVAGLSFCDARGLGALVRMSRHAGQAGFSLQLVAPPARLRRIICITGLEDKLPVHREDQAGQAQVA
jgi:anti-sigma B factor antagonist